jgi:hypothetical protein
MQKAWLSVSGDATEAWRALAMGSEAYVAKRAG